jgi:hypothetical protein
MKRGDPWHIDPQLIIASHTARPGAAVRIVHEHAPVTTTRLLEQTFASA